MKSKNAKLRLIYGGLFLILVIVEFLIALFVRDSFIRPYFGDVLISVALCLFVRIFFPKGATFLPLYVFLFSAAVEVAQYFDYARLLGLDRIPFFKILLGSTFSLGDLICYAVGCLLYFFGENFILHLFERSGKRHGR